MTEAEKRYHDWRACALDNETAAELNAIESDGAQIEERFCRELSFGTGGLRGELGAGTARMNVDTVRRATQGLADFLLAHTDWYVHPGDDRVDMISQVNFDQE